MACTAPPVPQDNLDATLERVALVDVRPHLMQTLSTHGVYHARVGCYATAI